MAIERDGEVIWEGETRTSGLKRRLEELVEYLFREDDFPDGVIISTGTALVPDSPFTLEAGDFVVSQFMFMLPVLRSAYCSKKYSLGLALARVGRIGNPTTRNWER